MDILEIFKISKTLANKAGEREENTDDLGNKTTAGTEESPVKDTFPY